MDRQKEPIAALSTPATGDRFLLWADLIRNVSVLLVILEHVSAVPMFHRSLASSSWMVANLYNVISRACVPMFFMVSGALLLPRQESISDFYRKRFKRIAIPFVVWSVIYLLAGGTVPLDTPLSAVKYIIRTLLERPAEYHLWFMYDLFWLYLFTPVFRVFIAHAKREHVWYFIAVWFIFGALQGELESLAGFEFIPDFGLLTGYLGYFILGSVLAQSSFSRHQTALAALMYLLAGTFTVLATYQTSLTIGGLDTYYQTLINWNIVLLSVAAFILLKSLGDKMAASGRPRLKNWIQRLAPATFGIYLIHIFTLRYFGHPSILLPGGLLKLPPRYSLTPMMEPSILVIPALTMAVFLASWLIISLIRKIPYLRAIT